MKIHFHTGENPFSWVRKSIFMGMKIVDHPEEAIDKVGIVLFLKKVHSWGGVTEMVLGLFLLFL